MRIPTSQRTAPSNATASQAHLHIFHNGGATAQTYRPTHPRADWCSPRSSRFGDGGTANCFLDDVETRNPQAAE
ncbi:hypothetical protein PAAG_12193 [Paracoccidioides lutzii Pb01]|uniref:Uncharacterized protein n=1 Tax=Paracoccidioides lutzii (strain ATCC MYA-826 / Pb01) TaxID=502779 RepID=A0A0A2V4X9_PARBA|nr:hypothetical protein PAAG_12193 [Paracoccidioides lutzii Pb01]KGQ01155.1 hypothetical protein PAAG_12193 [Paracoccidioides lutzii Pb01]